YEQYGDLAYYDGMSEAILCVGLVKPKPGIFQPHVRYLLVLATPVEIVVLGMCAPSGAPGDGGAEGEGLLLLPEPIYSLPTDNTYFQAVCGTTTGRVFLAARDGCLYELDYQAEAGWFSHRCRKINHSKSFLWGLMPSVLQFGFSEEDPVVQIAMDDSRHVLYTRTERGCLQVFDLGADGHGMTRVASLSHSSIVNNAAHVARSVDRSNFKPIIHISAIEKSESLNCHLLAVTHTGVRLYFAVRPFQSTQDRPSGLSLVHVRLPPGFSASAVSQRPARVHRALYSRAGTLLLAAAESEDSDTLWCIDNASYPFRGQLMESQVTMGAEVRAWALECVGGAPPARGITPLNGDRVPHTEPPSVAVQHATPPPRFILLSAQVGSHPCTWPILLNGLFLISFVPPCSVLAASFVLWHVQEDQACATCLILACSRAAHDSEVSMWAARAFYRYGGEAQMRFSGMLPQTMLNFGSPVASSTMLRSPAPSSSPYPKGHGIRRPSVAPGTPPTLLSPQQAGLAAPGTDAAGAGLGPEVVFSGRHDGTCLYLARILSNFWDGNVVLEHTIKEGNRQLITLDSAVAVAQLDDMITRLEGLVEFLDKDAQFAGPSLTSGFATSSAVPQRLLGYPRVDGGGGQHLQQEMQRKYNAEAQAHERASLQQVGSLVHHVIQTLALWKLLCEHGVPVLTAALPPDIRDTLKAMSLQELVLRGDAVTGGLITALINRYIGDLASTDSISQHLRAACPLLYSVDDVTCSKANELLQKSRQQLGGAERERALRESLQLYRLISHQVDLPLVCSQYRHVRFYEGVLELSLGAAERLDPQGLGLHFYKNGEPSEDAQGRQAYMERLECYRCVTDMLQELVQASRAPVQSPSVPSHPGPPAAPADTSPLPSTEQAAQHYEQMLRLAQRCTDELFHISLYEWLVAAGLPDKLVQVSSPYLQPYLVRMSSLQQDKLTYLDLLWRFHQKSGAFGAAARVLARLSDMSRCARRHHCHVLLLLLPLLPLKLSAFECSEGRDRERNAPIREHTQVARIQLHIQKTLGKSYGAYPGIAEALRQLDSQLMDVTKLYGDFADPYHLSECKLAILHCASHADTTLVQTLWRDIVEKELQESISRSPADRMQLLNQKLVSLGKSYSSTPQYFPLEFLVLTLEQHVCTLGWDEGFVPHTLLQVGADLPLLLHTYDKVFRTKDTCWYRLRQPLHLLHSIRSILNKYLQQPETVPPSERRLFTNTCLDLMADYLMELKAMEQSLELQQTVGSFRSLQAKLERLL
uniref:Nucleoporin 155 n=1 Tax=Petromyzon marinus TaxID=7757 RepID=S4RQG5_PETMA